jgi:hypothetical protein
LPFIVNDQAKAAGSIMNLDVNGAMSMSQCIAQGFSPNLHDLLANAGSHRQFCSMDAVLDGSPPLFRKWRRRKGKRLV